MAELMYDQFKIGIKRQLNNQDISSLTLLYLPLIGLDSYAFYCCLASLNENEMYNYRRILDILSFKNIKTIQNSEEKLQGVGLLKAYKHEQKGYLYEMLSPLSEKEFIQNELLYRLLETQIGTMEIDKIRSKYNISNKGYKEVTKAFDEVFDISTKTIKKVLEKIIKTDINIKNEDFNYTLFKMQFDSSFLGADVLEKDDFKKMITQISFLYKLNETEMKDLVFETINIDKRLDTIILSKNARILFQKKYKTDNPKLVTIKDDSYISSIQDDETIQLCQYLESVTPAEVLQSLSGISPSVAELKMIDDLITNCKLSLGVINFMLLYVNEEQSGTLPGYNYFEKIANTWARAKIKTPLDAIRYIEKRKHNKPSTSKNVRVAPLPDWYSEYEEGLKNTDVKPISDTEMEDILEKAKTMFEG